MATQADKMIIVICPNLRCRSVLQVPEHARGKKVRCGHCGQHFLVPQLRRGPAPSSTQASPGANAAPEAIEKPAE